MKRTGIVLTVWLGAFGSSCSPGALGRAVRPQAPTANSALDENPCVETPKFPRPLVVDWKDHERADLELAMRDGVAVVRYDCETLKLVDDCRVEGSYGYMGVSRKENTLQLRDADEIRINLPAAGAALVGDLGGELDRGATLDLATVMVGKRRTTVRKAERSQLEGECDGGTHIVRGAFVGAFSMKTGSRGKVQMAASLFGAQAGASSASSRFAGTRDGSTEACQKSTLNDEDAPQDCRALLRLELAALKADQADSKQAPRCGPGFVHSDGKCARKAAVESYECDLGDWKDCDKQCGLGNLPSCVRQSGIYSGATYVASGPPKDEARALRLLQRACDGAYARGCWLLGLSYRGPKTTEEQDRLAAAAFERACDLGDATGCLSLASLYVAGRGVPRDPSSGARLMRRSCNGGEAKACSRLARYYDEGTGVAKNNSRAFALIQRVCQTTGKPSDCVALADRIRDGKGVARNPKRAAEMYRRYCDPTDQFYWATTNQGACFKLADLLIAQPNMAFDDKEFARFLAAKCKETRGAPACAFLALLHRAGRGVPRDDRRATELLELSCKQGLCNGCYGAAEAYTEGRGVGRSQKRAAEIYLRVCKRSGGQNPCECFKAAQALAKGEGVPQDGAEAIRLFEKGCRGEYPESKYCLGLGAVYEKGLGTKPNRARALELYDQVCDRLTQKTYFSDVNCRDAERCREPAEEGCRRANRLRGK